MAIVAACSSSATSGPTAVKADQHVAVRVDGHPCLAAAAVGVQRRAGDGPQVVVGDSDGDAGGGCHIGGEADGGDLGIGEDDLRDGAFVGSDCVPSPRTQVGLVATGPGGEGVAEGPGLVLAVVGQEDAPVDVACGVEPAPVDRTAGLVGDRERVVDGEPFPGDEAEVVEPLDPIAPKPITATSAPPLLTCLSSRVQVVRCEVGPVSGHRPAKPGSRNNAWEAR